MGEVTDHCFNNRTTYYFDAKTMTQSLTALIDILPGEEITTSYVNLLAESNKRRDGLLHNWNFDCKCSIHRLSAQHQGLSDMRVEKIVELHEKLMDWSPPLRMTGTERIEAALLYINLCEQERLHGSRVVGLEIAAYAYAAVADRYNAIKYASMALEGHISLTSSPDEVRLELGDLMLNPEGHWTWNLYEQVERMKGKEGGLRRGWRMLTNWWV